MKKRIMIVLLALMLMMGLWGCQPAPEKPEETTLPVPQASEVYAQACTLLNSAENVILDVVRSCTTTVGNSSFTEETEQVLSVSGMQTQTPVVQLTEEMTWLNLNDTQDASEEEKTYLYTEVYADETLYVKLSDLAAFSGSLSKDAAKQRYIPVTLLDADLYEELTLEESPEKDTISFKNPTAAESWAIPEGAQLQDASGTVTLSKDGVLQQMNYSVSYAYGSAQITLNVQSSPRAEAEAVAAPEDVDQYVSLQYVDALRTLINAENKTKQTKTASVSISNTVVSQAAAVVQSENLQADMYDVNDEMLYKSVSKSQLIDGSGQSQTSDTEVTYADGKYVVTTDGGLPTTQSGVKKGEMRQACEAMLCSVVATPEFWTEAVMTDLGGTYLVEYTYSDDYGNNNQNNICALLFNDMSLLNSLATDYVNKEVSGYLGIDKYTGLITSSGMYYEGAHTIEGNEYILSMGMDQAVKAPAFGAYSAITDENPEEEEPEEKPQPLFYHVTGAQGQEMWLLGTIHVGDARTAYLPKHISDAFAQADALALEFDTERFEEQAETDEKLQQQIAATYYYSDGTTIRDHLDAELYELALKHMKVSGNYSDSVEYLRVSLWETFISQFFLGQGHKLHAEQGVEERLTQWAKELEKTILEVESGLSQMQMFADWSDELQSLMLETMVETDMTQYWAETEELFELWCAGNEEALRAKVNEEEDLSQMTQQELDEYNAMLPLKQEYDQSMNFDRNEDMLKVAIEYLESDEVVFYAVGLAHLLDDTNGLVETLRQAGYSVEQVSYAE